jgi:uncharacterized protein
VFRSSPVVIGGTVPARYAPAAVFKTVFVLVALLTAVRLIFRDRLPTLGQEVPRRLRVPYGLAIGLSASLIGIGGGILSNMIMTFHGRAIHESIATSAGVGVMVSIPGALGYVVAGWDRMGLPPFSAGFVSIAAVLALRPTGFLAAKLGARVAHHLLGDGLSFALPLTPMSQFSSASRFTAGAASVALCTFSGSRRRC